MGGMMPEDAAADAPLPYLPSTRWMRCMGKGLRMKTRDYTRTRIWSNTPEGIVLTVPVVGGSSAAKRLKPSELRISGHGDWTRIHLGAIFAAYGKEPYFPHLFPEIASIIETYPGSLTELNRCLMEAILRFIDYESLMPEIRNMRLQNPERCASIAKNLESKFNPDYSFLEALFRLGRDTLFLLD